MERPSSPMKSPMHNHSRSGSAGGMGLRRGQNTAAKAAAQRLAQVMSQADDDDEEEDRDDEEFNYNISSGGIGLAGGRTRGSKSPMKIGAGQEQPISVRRGGTGRIATSTSSAEQQSSARSSTTTSTVRPSSPSREPSTSVRTASSGRAAQDDQPPSERYTSAGRQAQVSTSIEQPSSAKSISVGRQSQVTSSMEQPSSARASPRGSSFARPLAGAKAVPIMPAAVPITLRSTPSLSAMDENKKDNRLLNDMGSMNFRDREIPSHRSATALEDEVDMLQDENESLLEKLRLVEERCEEAEARARQLENQVAVLGEGVSLEARLLSRKEAALQQREAALRISPQIDGDPTEVVAALRAETEASRDEAESALELLQENENKLKSLRILTQRVMLTEEEMEDLAMKRCWLTRYWGLCVEHGIYAEIAGARHEYWSSFVSSPVDIVLAAGQEAEEEKDEYGEEIPRIPQDHNELYGEWNAENMLTVEKGLREMTSLKVENAVAIAMAQHQFPNSVKAGLSGEAELKLPTDGQGNGFELNEDESEDVFFKQAWLTYFWRRAKRHGVEADIADERMWYWINHNTKSLTSHDAVDVERGLKELTRSAIEIQLWEASRKALDEETSQSEKRISLSDF